MSARRWVVFALLVIALAGMIVIVGEAAILYWPDVCQSDVPYWWSFLHGCW